MHDERDVREARQQAGLSVLDIAHRTKISATTIEALERRDYAMLPEGAELDAVVRAYADQVGLDPDRLCARIRLERPAEEAEEYVLVPEDIETFPTEEHVSHETALPAGAQLEWYDQNISAVRAFDTEAASPAALSPVVTSKPVVRKPRPLGRVAIPMLALIAATGWGAYLYRMTQSFSHSLTPEIPAVTPRLGAAPERPVTHEADREAASQRSPGLVAETPDAARTRDSGEREDSAVQAGSGESVVDVSGPWMVTTRVESSRVSRFVGLRLGYELELRQEGNRVIGLGHKVSENGKALVAGARTPISVAGTLDRDRLALTFTERGVRRATEGEFSLTVTPSGVLQGRFSSGAARSTGSVAARRELLSR
jgi:transcriptional regulator with XRE-family HTH domain